MTPSHLQERDSFLFAGVLPGDQVPRGGPGGRDAPREAARFNCEDAPSVKGLVYGLQTDKLQMMVCVPLLRCWEIRGDLVQ